MNFSEIGLALREACPDLAIAQIVYNALVRAQSLTRDPSALRQILEGFGSLPDPGKVG